METERSSNCRGNASLNFSPHLLQQERSNKNAFSVNLLSKYTEALSSDGDSVSSHSMSADSYSSDNCTIHHDTPCTNDLASSSSMRNHFLFDGVSKGVRYLRNAGIFTREEVISQAIDRWTEYIRLCGRSLDLLRESMADNYIKNAVFEKVSAGKIGRRRLCSLGSQPVSLSTPTPAILSSKGSFRSFSAESSALVRFRRNSARVENRMRLASLSKFAIISSNLASWQTKSRKQICKYRDPTITTWEYRCTKTCIPLTSYCAQHLVLIESSELIGGAASVHTESVSHVGPAGDSQSVAPLHCDYSVSIKENKVCLKRKLPEPQKSPEVVPVQKEGTISPRQFLFRQCGGGPHGDCREPIISWSPSSRCCYHHSVNSLWQEVDCNYQPSSSFHTGLVSHHPSLVNFIRRFKERDLEKKLSTVKVDNESL